ncbi:DUF3713 domain-containing protein, partial [Mycoplasmoides gallisepticum]
TQNDNQMFADFQAYVFNQWVKRENPNLVSRIVFTNENINSGLDQIFDKKSFNFSASRKRSSYCGL